MPAGLHRDVRARLGRSLSRSWQRQVLARVFHPLLDTGGWRGCVLLSSSPRSGSTWVFELLNHQNDYRAIFEPLHPGRVPTLADPGLRQYRRPQDEAPEVLAKLTRLFSGELSNRWMDRFNRRWISERRLVKSVRSNLMLPWLAERFPSMPLVLLLRHPCAVVSSRKRLGWGSNLQPLLDQPTLCSEFLEPHIEAMQRANLFEQGIYKWAISQLVPLSLLRPGQALVVFYEDLVLAPEKYLPVLFDYTRTPGVATALAGVRRPSALTQRAVITLSSKQTLSAWQAVVTQEQRASAERILSGFGLDGLYDEHGLPRSRELSAQRFPVLGFCPSAVRVAAGEAV